MSPPEHQARNVTQDENTSLNLQARVIELETRNLYLQSLVVELLDKNEQLRRKLTLQEKPVGELLSQ